MARAPGIERIRHQHHVVQGRDFGAALGEHLPGEFHVVPDGEHARVGEQRLERGECVALRDLIGNEVTAEQSAALGVATLAVRQRHVASFVGRDRKRKTAKLRLHRIAGRARHIERDHAGIAGARDPGVEAVEAAHGFISAAIELGAACSLGARASECLWCRTKIAAAVARRGRSRRHAASGQRQRQFCAARWRARNVGALLRNGSGESVCLRSALPGEARFRLDGAGVDAGEFRDAAHQAVEFHRLEEGDQPFVVGLVHGEIVDRHIELHVIVERNELLRDAR